MVAPAAGVPPGMEEGQTHCASSGGSVADTFGLTVGEADGVQSGADSVSGGGDD